MELGLNAANPKAAQKNRRIYGFSIQNRDTYSLALEDPRGRNIAETAVARDLFTFDVGDGRQRANLEAAFGRFEKTLVAESRALLAALEAEEALPSSEMLQRLFVAKFLNALRSPFCVAKALNTIGAAASFSPTDPDLRKAYSWAIAGRRPHRTRICDAFALTSEEYDKWLTCLFMMLAVEVGEGRTVLETALLDLFAASAWYALVYSHGGSSDEQVCVLSDRGFSELENSASRFGVEFNVASRAYVRFGFLDVASIVPGAVARHGVGMLTEGLSPEIRVIRGDLAALESYNQRSVYQAARRVYAASAAPYGVALAHGRGDQR